MLGFSKPRQAEVLNHWYTPVAGFSASGKEFYAAIQKVLAEQQVPGLEVSEVEFSEGGLLSGKRTYLRMTRERLVFDVCAAPFGKNFFYSCRFAEIPAQISLIGLALVLLLFMAIVYASLRILGFWLSIVFWPVLLVSLVYVLRNAISLGLSDLDAYLIKQPLFGPIYDRFFRKETYYREDTRLMYLSVVDAVVKQLVENDTAAKGVKLVTFYEYSPILGELYRPRPKSLDTKPDPLLDNGLDSRQIQRAVS